MATYKVQENGKAPAGLSAGDQVVTGGGTYKITGVNADGSYISEKVSNTTTGSYTGSYSNKTGTTKKAVTVPNMDYSAEINKIIQAGGDYKQVQALLDQRNAKIDADPTLEKYRNDVTAANASKYITKGQQQEANLAQQQQMIQMLEELQGNKPGYTPLYDNQIQAIYDKIMSRPDFKYDLGSDMLYQQYKDQYINNGQLAMMDTMGEAASLTGGYGSTYGQAVGQQQYDAYLQQLNDKIPEFYDRAMNAYNQEGDKLMQQYGLLADMDDRDYQRYLTSYDQWAQDRSYLTDRSDTAYDRDWDYEGWMQNTANDAWDKSWQQKEWDYGVQQDNYSKQQDSYSKLRDLIGSTGYKPTDSELTKAGMSREEADAWAKAYTDNKPAYKASGSGSGDRYSNGNTSPSTQDTPADDGGAGRRRMTEEERQAKLAALNGHEKAMSVLNSYHGERDMTEIHRQLSYLLDKGVITEWEAESIFDLLSNSTEV